MPKATTAPPYAYYVQAPVHMINALVLNKQKEVPSLDFGSGMLNPLVDVFNSLIIHAQSSVLRMSSEEAKAVINELTPIAGMISHLDRMILEVEPEETKDINYIQVRSMWNNVKELLDDINMVANAQIIDESSEDYLSFLSKLTNECDSPANTRTYGYTAFSKLFE